MFRTCLSCCLVLVAAAALPGCSAEHGADHGAHAMQRYRSADHGLSFAYPQGWYLLEQRHDGGEPVKLSLVLVEDLPANRAYLAGTPEQPAEAPPMITVDVYDNPEGLTAPDWVSAHTNWILTDKRPELVRHGSETYLIYFWDGLYAGKSAVAVRDGHTFVFSVTWIDETDPLVGMFSALLAGARLTDG